MASGSQRNTAAAAAERRPSPPALHLEWLEALDVGEPHVTSLGVFQLHEYPFAAVLEGPSARTPMGTRP